MTLSEARGRAKNPTAFDRGDKFVVLCTDGSPLESHPTRARAERAAMWCNEHEARNHRPEGYTVEELT